MSGCYDTVAILCVAIVGIRLFSCFISALFRYLGPYIRGELNLKKEGSWCVVTGATDGIGKAFCYKAASQGVNVVLISRTKEKLSIVADEIEEKFGVQTRAVVIDFTKGPEIYPIIQRAIADLEIGTLVNNVGLSYPYPEYFLNIKDQLCTDIINTNIRSVTFMCKMVMPQMVARHRGTVINLSSTSSLIQSPMLTVYGATKSYIRKFTSDLHSEYRKDGLNISCLSPGYVATKMSGIRKATLMAPSPDTYVSHALRTVGLHHDTTGYFPHSAMVGVINLIDFICHDAARIMITRIMGNIRARAIKKAAK